LIESQQFLEGTLTMFSGFPFGHDHPFTYLEGKRVLELALGELKKRRDLCDQLKMNRKRPAGGSEKATFEIAASALCHADRSARSRIGIVILYPDTAGFPVSLIWILARVLNLDCRLVTGNSVRRAGSNSPP
jgi:hypothetical protein